MNEEQIIRQRAAELATDIATSQNTLISINTGDELITVANQIAGFIKDGTVPAQP